MPASAIFRLPYQNHAYQVTQTDGEPLELLSCTELSGREGFVVAPFETRTNQPILVIRPDKVERIALDNKLIEEQSRPLATCHPIDPSAGKDRQRNTYTIDFANYHAQLELGVFRKIVLARCAEETSDEALDPMTLFYRACAFYPRMFISLVNTRKSGCWLTATPEILLDNKGTNRWQTVALAGTMKLEGEQLDYDGPVKDIPVSWTTKNIQEQRFVATYITECLERFTSEFSEDGPITVRAANLVHLRSDFNFSLPDDDRIGDLLQALHPTPAVCGLPKQDAFRFIVHNEQAPRRYYSGFMGPLHIMTSDAHHPETHLYVSLRCMNIKGNHYDLYAGGGLLTDSDEEQEWQETEAKLETMRRCLAIRKM